MNRYKLTPSPTAAKEQEKRDYIHAFEKLSWAEDKIIAICQKHLSMNVETRTFAYIRVYGQVLMQFSIQSINGSTNPSYRVYLPLDECDDESAVVSQLRMQLEEQIAKSKRPSELEQAYSRIKEELKQIRPVSDRAKREKEELLTRWLR